MSTTHHPEALNLEEFRAKVTHAAREPLLARIAELEAQLSATKPIQHGLEAQTTRDAVIQHLTNAGVLEHDGCGIFIASGDASELIDACMAISTQAHPAEEVPAQIETLRAELAEETEAAENWRRLALQFDNHRMQALGHLKAILHPDSSVDEYKAAELFLKAPPLDGESVLAQRIAELSAAQQAQEDAPVGFAWSGWACMYPGKLPRLYGALEIASVNLDAANGDQLIHLSTSPDPQAQADARDAARLLYATKDCDGFFHVMRDKHEFTLECMEEAGRSEPTIEDELNGVRRLIDAALAAQTKQGV